MCSFPRHPRQRKRGKSPGQCAQGFLLAVNLLGPRMCARTTLPGLWYVALFGSQLPALGKSFRSGLLDELADHHGFRDIKVVDEVLQLFP
jgi:hypothetical protein